jgi:hypothetical protein
MMQCHVLHHLPRVCSRKHNHVHARILLRVCTPARRAGAILSTGDRNDAHTSVGWCLSCCRCHHIYAYAFFFLRFAYMHMLV